ncbi:MAG: hypothetical protein L6Q54_14825 [Leptospiraceae bacterium]|nr:hypothetical protein [Leptospiraceae bacterium]MCK6382508.1 hypothetical protein [Leptospiraceae bacterium]NUM41155.1 hypothetical protein [Leptospiraceae bacterium]
MKNIVLLKIEKAYITNLFHLSFNKFITTQFRFLAKIWKQFSALVAIVLISYSLLLQNLHSSELIVFVFVCQCNHNSEFEKHEVNTKFTQSDLNSIPDCHKKKSSAHVCTCKNGSILKKMNDFLAQFVFIQNFESLYKIVLLKGETIKEAHHFLVDVILSSIERPPIS